MLHEMDNFIQKVSSDRISYFFRFLNFAGLTKLFRREKTGISVHVKIYIWETCSGSTVFVFHVTLNVISMCINFWNKLMT